MVEEDADERAVFRAAYPIDESVVEFSLVAGLCRTCTHAFLYQRAYGDEVHVVCDALHPPLRMPLDVVRCSRYEKRGQLSLSSMNEMAIPVDGRPDPKGYL